MDTAGFHLRLAPAVERYLTANGDKPAAWQAVVDAATHPLKQRTAEAAELEQLLRDVQEGRRTDTDVANDIAWLELLIYEGRTTPLDPDNTTGPSTWLPIDTHTIIAGLLDGTITRPAPTIGRRSDGQAIFYPGRVNQLFSDPGTGKGWVALHVAAQELAAGHHVVYFDLEDTCDGILARLLDLGVNPDHLASHFHYIAPEGPYGIDDQDGLQEWLHTIKPSLGIVDSTGEAIAINGLKPNNDEEVAHWFHRLPRHLVAADVCCLLIDHVPKDKDGRLMPIGSQRKLAAITGASYSLEAAVELGKGRAGIAKLVTRKDRNGTFIRGHKAADFHLDATSPRLTAHLEPPAGTAGTEGGFQPTILMDHLSRWLELQTGDITKNTWIDAVKGRDDYKRQAIDLLLAGGWVERTQHGQRQLFRSLNPYRHDDGPTVPDRTSNSDPDWHVEERW